MARQLMKKTALQEIKSFPAGPLVLARVAGPTAVFSDAVTCSLLHPVVRFDLVDHHKRRLRRFARTSFKSRSHL